MKITTVARYPHHPRARNVLFAGHAMVGCLALLLAPDAGAAENEDASTLRPGTSVSFARDSWDASVWTPIRLPHQKTTKSFAQREESIGVEAFTAEEKKGRLDNILLMTDTGTDEGEFEVTFSLSEQPGTAPGIFIGPVVKDGVLDSAIALFVASYTMAIWRAEFDPETGETKYTHLVRVNRWTQPNQKHVVRCRYSGKRKAVVIRLDQSDPIMLRDVGIEVNSLIGIWGCHGRCDFYSVTRVPDPVLPWSASAPE